MKKIAILTSGGDASTMNKCLSTFITYASKYNCEVVFVKNGYKGIYDNEFVKPDYTETKSWWSLPGTKIYSSRFPEILDEQVRKQMVDNLHKNSIDTLVVIGGDGSYKGARLLSKSGIKVIGLPGTIDNDIASTSYSIGFDTSLNAIVNSIKEIKSCMDSHANVAMIEIMGRHCIDLTVFAGIATEADIIITPESFYTPQQLLAKINEKRKTNSRGIIILYVELLLGTENIPTVEEYIKYIQANSKESVKKNILGYLQRGGNPTAMDMIRASLMTEHALKMISENQYNKIIGVDEFKVVSYDLETAINMKNPSRKDLIDKFFN
ncbi:6-phosphofructokinase [Malacoplasma penetrans HF-2]|uniref:Probable ATP-dependent 6-phosphofructokinase n=1 Tax=Malacoplasma penetrans (strain HF-2) TaxID=272633 RepID=PFKA_MALP2|nr:ATP-dependent 6-phosphofructokinase [Malacoplasma penetrans]Q8EVH2.1 RecName: Full=Probable ATP-dependent 6-phosphofructokinase; Short=ATP-PFK; Short=Phosphofructokinase; AltName: Full=Phosphohexokinase [Malacoplasma penetrans HF-2]BAC44382.1 6-phosphofructokinase [Malacoplasma penetrans HF-2]